MNNRLSNLRRSLQQQDLDAVLISQPENRRYLSGFTGSAGSLVISQQEAILATDFRYWEQVGRQSPDFSLLKITQGDVDSWLPPVLEHLQPKTLGFEASDVTYALHGLLKKAISHLKPSIRPKLVPCSELVENLRISKGPEELKTIAKAVNIGDEAFKEVTSALEPGVTEKQVGWLLEKAMREKGAESTSFDTIVAWGPNGALPHHHPSDQPITPNAPVVIDMGCRVDGYCSDMTRTIYLGRADDRFKRVYDTVLGAQETAISAIRSGLTGHQGDQLARDVIEKAGYGESFGHGTGHGVGLAVHELPRVGRNSKSELLDGMVFTIEPGIYIHGWGGVRIEDMVVLENGKARDLTRAPKLDVLRV